MILVSIALILMGAFCYLLMHLIEETARTDPQMVVTETQDRMASAATCARFTFFGICILLAAFPPFCYLFSSREFTWVVNLLTVIVLTLPGIGIAVTGTLYIVRAPILQDLSTTVKYIQKATVIPMIQKQKFVHLEKVKEFIEGKLSKELSQKFSRFESFPIGLTGIFLIQNFNDLIKHATQVKSDELVKDLCKKDLVPVEGDYLTTPEVLQSLHSRLGGFGDRRVLDVAAEWATTQALVDYISLQDKPVLQERVKEWVGELGNDTMEDQEIKEIIQFFENHFTELVGEQVVKKPVNKPDLIILQVQQNSRLELVVSRQNNLRSFLVSPKVVENGMGSRFSRNIFGRLGKTYYDEEVKEEAAPPPLLPPAV